MESLVLAAQTTKLEKVKAALKNQKIKSDEFLLNKSTSFHVESQFSLGIVPQLANTRDMGTIFFKNLPVHLYLFTTLYMIYSTLTEKIPNIIMSKKKKKKKKSKNIFIY